MWRRCGSFPSPCCRLRSAGNRNAPLHSLPRQSLLHIPHTLAGLVAVPVYKKRLFLSELLKLASTWIYLIKTELFRLNIYFALKMYGCVRGTQTNENDFTVYYYSCFSGSVLLDVMQATPSCCNIQFLVGQDNACAACRSIPVTTLK